MRTRGSYTFRFPSLAQRIVGPLLVLALSLPTLALGQTADDFTRIGNDAYNSKRYSEAVSAYVKAIQAEPTTAARAYKNLARAYNKLSRYTESVQYYEWYLELNPEASDARKIRGELKAAARSAAGKPSGTLSDAQQAALGQFESAMKVGPYLSDDGGAVALYEVLLRTGYATPMLAAMKKTLAARLTEEARAHATPKAGSPTPSLDREGWERVRERVERAAEFSGEPLSKKQGALRQLAAGWEAYFKGKYAQAESAFTSARRDDPELLAAYWGAALAGIYGTGEVEARLAHIQEAEKAYTHAGVEATQHFVLLRAMALQTAGKHREAAKLVGTL